MMENEFRQEFAGSFVPSENTFQKMPWSRNVQGVSISKLTMQEQMAKTWELGGSKIAGFRVGAPMISIDMVITPPHRASTVSEFEVDPAYYGYAVAEKLYLRPHMRALKVLGNYCVWDGQLKQLGDIYVMTYQLPATPDFAAERHFDRESLEIMEEWALHHAGREAPWPEGPIRYLLGLFIRSRDWGQ